MRDASPARRVLFVDDDESILRVLEKFFARRGYETYSARSGREGINTYLRVSPDVMVLDLHMPDISGLNVMEELRPKRPMVIMLTGDFTIIGSCNDWRIFGFTFRSFEN